MTTTEPTPTRRGPRWDVDGRALRLWTITGLATTYLIAWWGLAPEPTAAPVAATEPAPVTATSTPTTASTGPIPPAVWWHDVPAAQRPRVALPPGWVVTAAHPGDGPVLAAAPSPRRPARRVRVRTRSS